MKKNILLEEYMDALSKARKMMSDFDSKPYRDECIRVEQIARKYIKKFESYWEEAKNKVVREEYAPQSSMYRGTYCPSLIEDIVLGNVKRKALYKRRPKMAKSYFQYGFDKDNNLVLVEYFSNPNIYYCEVIFRENNYELGIKCRPLVGYSDFLICECYYENGKLSSYALYTYFEEAGIERFDKEIYEYSQEQMIVHALDYNNIPKPQLSKTKYTFVLENDYLKSYTAEEYLGDKRKDSTWGSAGWQVGIERKV